MVLDLMMLLALPYDYGEGVSKEIIANGPVNIADIRNFPAYSREESLKIYWKAKEIHQRLEAQRWQVYYFHLPKYDESMRYMKWCQEVWDAYDYALYWNQCGKPMDACLWLLKLRFLLGNEDYYTGRLPVVPSILFEDHGECYDPES